MNASLKKFTFTFRTQFFQCWILVALTGPTDCLLAQVNSGSNGSDGAFNPTEHTIINMADHPDGIYHYTSVNIPGGVTVTFMPNANNTPVVWLVQSNCVINGNLYMNGTSGLQSAGGSGGPGGFRGGNGGPAATSGQGPGGGVSGGSYGTNASFGAFGAPSSPTYGNAFLVPLLGGSGGGGSLDLVAGGGGGGGALLIACSQTIEIGASGYVSVSGGNSASRNTAPHNPAGAGSGGAVRLVASRIIGSGAIVAESGHSDSNGGARIANGRIRFDVLENLFSGNVVGVFSHGFQPVIIPSPGQLPQLTVTSVGGVPVSASPSGQLSTPDAVLSAQQNNPVPVVVRCSNIPLNTQITVTVKPANGPAVSATGLNSSGTVASSTAAVNINMPRGGGIIYVTAATSN